MASKLTASGFFLRFAAALVLVLASFNPSGYSFVHWAQDQSQHLSLKVLAGIILLIAWVVFIRASLRSLGFIGMVLVAALFGSVVWVFVDFGWLALDNVSALSYLLLVMLAFLLAVGMSWSHIRRRLSGQVDVDEIDQ